MQFGSYRNKVRGSLARYSFCAVVALTFCQITTATEAMPQKEESAQDKLSVQEGNLPGPLALGVTGASAGITPDYFEQAVTEAIAERDIFSGIDNTESAEFIMPMIRAKGVFPGPAETGNTPYLLDIRVIKVDTPSFSVRMTVGMNAVWTLYRVSDKAELLHENIYSTYTGGVFEGGIHGANRVRVAMEGATRENVRIGVEMLESLGLESEPASVALEHEDAQLSGNSGVEKPE